MDERVAYTVEDPQSDHPGVSRQPPLPLPPGHPMSSLVVQVPKDQVYRFPPQEHAQIAENHRKKAAAKNPKRKFPCLKYIFFLFVVLFVIALLTGAAIAVVFNSFKPKDPAFSVSSFVVKQHKGSPPTYDVKLRIKNPNPKMGVKYASEEDDSRLSFGKRTLGWGRFPEFGHEKGNTTVEVNVKFTGVRGQTLPASVKNSMNDTKTKNPLSLTLDVEAPLVFNVWILRLWRKDMEVKCEFRVDTMGHGTKILSQDCNTKMS